MSTGDKDGIRGPLWWLCSDCRGCVREAKNDDPYP